MRESLGSRVHRLTMVVWRETVRGGTREVWEQLNPHPTVARICLALQSPLSHLQLLLTVLLS